MVLIGLTAMTFNFFDFLENTEEATLDLFSFMAGPKIPTNYNEEFSVVLVDGAYVAKHTHWPMQYHEHATVLRTILEHKPKAVFIDMLFAKDKQSQGIFPLILVLNEYKKQDVPVYLAAAEAGGEIHPLLVKLVIPVTTRLEEGEASEHDYPLIRPGAITPLTPAMALASEYCSHAPRDLDRRALWGEACRRLEPLGIHRPGLSAKRDPALAPPPRLNPMLLMWGTEHAEANETAFKCNPAVGATVTDQAEQVLMSFLFPGSQQLARERCPRIPTLLLDNLLGGFSKEVVSRYLYEKVVLYGPEIEGATVWTSPPTHEKLSATFTHATALENLLIYGDGYFTRDWPIGEYSLKKYLERGLWLSLCVIVAFLSVRADWLLAYRGATIFHRLAFDVAQFVMVAAISLGLGAIQVIVFRMAPANVLAIIAIVTGSVELRDSGYVQAIERFVNGVLVGRWLHSLRRRLRKILPPSTQTRMEV